MIDLLLSLYQSNNIKMKQTDYFNTDWEKVIFYNKDKTICIMDYFSI